MLTFSNRIFSPILAAAAVLALAIPRSANAQTVTQVGAEPARIMVVKGNDVYVRCGAAESYYPFARVNAGDLVKVTSEKYEWCRVMTMGPAFQSAFGYIKYAKGDAGRFRLAPDGKSGVTLGKIDVIAPNLDAKSNPKDSWKAIVRLEADQPLRVIETIETDKETIQKVVLPAGAQGWISTAYLEPASPEQASQWTAGFANQASRTATTTETSTANSTSSTTPVATNAEPATDSETETSPTPSAMSSMSVIRQIETESAWTAPSTSAPTIDPATTESTTASNSQTTMQAAAPPEPKRVFTLEELEAALKLLQQEPIETAEVTPLRELYLELARQNAGEKRTVRFATGRAEQLQVWADLQKKRQELEEVRARTKARANETDAAWKELERSTEYVAVGRVAASTIYDGKSLPKLLRIQDAASGRTIAYLQPDEKYELVNLIGNLIGVVGQKNYDESLRLNIVDPRRVDLLMPEGHHAAVKTSGQEQDQ